MTGMLPMAKGVPSRDVAPPRAHLEDLVRVVWQVPKQWIALMIALAVLSSVHVHGGTSGDYAVDISVGTLAIVAVGLIWLPALLRLLLLTGGSLKAGGVEAAAAGMFTREQLMDVMTTAKAVTTLREDEIDAGRSAIAELGSAVDRLAYDVLDSAHSLSSDVLKGLAMDYERLRRDSAPGPLRTSAMTRIVNETRVRAASSKDMAGAKATQLLRSRSQGERIVGLALTQESAPADSFVPVIRLISNSATAFEMFHALLALQEIAPFLDEAQREEAVATLVREDDDPRHVGIHNDPGLPALLKRTLAQVRSGGRES